MKLHFCPSLTEKSSLSLINLTHLMFAGNKISIQTDIGTTIAIAGVAIYSYLKVKIEEEKQVSQI